jgi:rod shape-determining protein MreC
MGNKTRATILVFFFVIAVTIAAHNIGLLRPFDALIRHSVYPVASLFHGSTSADDLSHLSRSELANQLRAYQHADTDLDVLRAQVTSLTQTNTQLREQLNFVTSSSWHVVGGDVVSRTIDRFNTGLIINVGSQHGIKYGNPVFVGEGVMIGSIVSVEPHSSFVRLISDTRSRVGAAVLNLDASVGVVQGDIGISTSLTLVPQNHLLQIGDTVVTSGIEETVPPGLFLGKVTSVEKEPFEPFQSATIFSGVQYTAVNTLSVITADFPS